MVTIDPVQSELIFDALGHRTRRDILGLLRTGPLAVGEIADRLPVSRPAVSKHLRLLSHAGLVRHSPAGTRHVFQLDRTGFEAARAHLEEFWTVALANFERLVASRSSNRV